MITVTAKEIALMSGTNRLICNNALRRGWKVRTPYVPCPHLFIDRGDGNELHIFSATPNLTSYASAHLVDDKWATSVVLQDAHIRQLETMWLDQGLLCLEEAKAFLNDHGMIVVKPIDGGHGKGITLNVHTKEQLLLAHEYAMKYNRTLKGSLLQKQFIAELLCDIRIAVIDGEVVGAIERVPARVRGDGVHTISELIDIENQKSERGEPYRAKLAFIDTMRASLYLGEKLHDVLAEGEELSVLGVANYGAGGELIDVTDDMPDWLMDEAIRAAEKLELPVAGVDYLVNTRLKKDMSRNQVEAVITEVNKCPALAIHDEPTIGINRHTVEKYLDFIATL